ncbi:MAG: molybdate ABC transporter permease subunit [Proteobacteria bacterium]|nr:molybdate ABC transporter permease subunit [Pseudomonadota bacterium]MBS0462773.1 molybdate ABC transporter permease subunit [Pseudomonadota bacterium]MBS0465545.1 molybdate ABC transporter permease subunit [Pseudomonadota bacterium]
MTALTADEVEAIWLSLKIAAVAVAASAPLAIAVGCALARARFPGKVLFDALIHLPLVLPPVLTGYLLLVLLGRHGAIGARLHDWFGVSVAFRWTGAAIAAGVMAFPLFVRAVRLSIEAIPRELDEVAASLGASRWQRFWRVLLPLGLPGILAGCTLAFAKALGEFGATITFVSNIPGQTRTIALAIQSLTQVPDGAAGIGRLAIVSIVLSLGALAASEWLARRVVRRH